jgi:predicted ester cyclase
MPVAPSLVRRHGPLAPASRDQRQGGVGAVNAGRRFPFEANAATDPPATALLHVAQSSSDSTTADADCRVEANEPACGRPRVHPLAHDQRRPRRVLPPLHGCCNEHGFADLGGFVAHDVVINGTDRGLDAYADGLRAVVRAFPDYRWGLRHLMVDAPWIAAHLADTGTHRRAFFGVQATGRSVSTQEFAFYRVDAGRIAEVWGTAFHVLLLERLR